MTFDPEAATRAYIDSLGAEELAKAAAYTTGNHWLLPCGLVVAGVVTWIIVRWGILDRLAARLSKRGPRPAVVAMLGERACSGCPIPGLASRGFR